MSRTDDELRSIAKRIVDIADRNEGDNVSLLAAAKATYKARRERDRLFSCDLFGEPAWDLLLDAFIQHLEVRTVSVYSLVYASAAPSTTALRYIQCLVNDGMLQKRAAEHDKRITYVALTTKGYNLMCSYFAKVSSASLIRARHRSEGTAEHHCNARPPVLRGE